MLNDEKRYKVKEAAKLLTISLSEMYKLLAAGKIIHERHGLGRGTIRIPESALEKYREACTKGADSPPVLLKLRNLKLSPS